MRAELKEKAHELTDGIRPSLFFPMFIVMLISILANILIVGIFLNVLFVYINSIYIEKFVKTGTRTFESIKDEVRDRTRLYALARPAILIFAIPFAYGVICAAINALFGLTGVYWLTHTVGFILSVGGTILGLFIYLDYYFVPYLMYDADYSYTTREVMELSKSMAAPIRWQTFVFELSFILHLLLVGVTFGIYIIWFVPYHETAKVLYYEHVKAEYLASHSDPLSDRIREKIIENDDELSFDDIVFDDINKE